MLCGAYVRPDRGGGLICSASHTLLSIPVSSLVSQIFISSMALKILLFRLLKEVICCADRDPPFISDIPILSFRALNGAYVPPAPGGDLLRDGSGVLPTGGSPFLLAAISTIIVFIRCVLPLWSSSLRSTCSVFDR